MRSSNPILLLVCLFCGLGLYGQLPETPIVDSSLIFAEQDGVVSVEAEHFYKQTRAKVRKWYRITPGFQSGPLADADPEHTTHASNGMYVEILPDTRTNHQDKLVAGENFMNEPGNMAILHYKVHVSTPGRYYVWVRAYSTGTEDNGLHVGIDGSWPEHGRRMQWTAKRQWFWDCKQRTKEKHTGVPMEIYLDISAAGIHEIMFSMREDGFEFDQFMLVKDADFRPDQTPGPASHVYQGQLPKPIAPATTPSSIPAGLALKAVQQKLPNSIHLPAASFPIEGTNFYRQKEWLAINPNQHQSAQTSLAFDHPTGAYDILLIAVGENDGKSRYEVLINDRSVMTYTVPLSKKTFETGAAYTDLWESIEIKRGDTITVRASIGSEDGQEYSRGRWQGILLTPVTKGKEALAILDNPTIVPAGNTQLPQTRTHTNLVKGVDGDGTIQIVGELKAWHKVTLALAGPFANELDQDPNPFMDYRMMVHFVHESGSPDYWVPGYFAADGAAAETSATAGNIWKAHLSPDKTGKWTYEVSFLTGEMVAVLDVPWAHALDPYHELMGSFIVGPSDKTAPDFRARGRLAYVEKHHLQFQGDQTYFVKAGADAPETLLAYQDFDNTQARKAKVPLKTYTSHLPDWKEGDPTWQDQKGKGIIGAVNYLASKGVNTWSFLTYNAGGDGDNVWPFVDRDDKYHYDCSKLDQWQVVFDHAQDLGVFLHFKTQETEIDDNRRGKKKADQRIKESLDGGNLGPQRRLYYRELIARYGYLLALNWNLGEENTQTPSQQKAMASFIDSMCPYPHLIVIHTFPNQQDKVYPNLIGPQSQISGASLQNPWHKVHERTLKWVTASQAAGKPWVVANDEQNSAGEGVPPDPGYKGYQADRTAYSIHDIRKQVLWGNIMAGGAGVEYYFGYKLPENDLLAEDFRSRDLSWTYAGIALNFLSEQRIPFWELSNHDELVENPQHGAEKYCLAKPGYYLIYVGYVPTTNLDLREEKGKFQVLWFNPRTGGSWQVGQRKYVKGGKVVELGNGPQADGEDWVILVKRIK